MQKASFLVTDGIPGIAAEGEIIKVSEDGILIGRWLSISKYPQLMESRHSLRPTSGSQYSPPTRSPRRPRGWSGDIVAHPTDHKSGALLFASLIWARILL